jgi:hypothetical protein
MSLWFKQPEVSPGIRQWHADGVSNVDRGSPDKPTKSDFVLG